MRRHIGLGLALAGILGLAGCGGAAPSATQAAGEGIKAKAAQPRSGTCTGWVGQKNLYLSLFASAFGNGRYGDKDVRLDMIFDNRVRGTVGDIEVEISSFNGQLHGYVGKYPVWATYYNGRVSAYNGSRAIQLNEFGSGLSGWVGHDTANVSWFGNLAAIEKIALIAVIMTELAPEQKR